MTLRPPLGTGPASERGLSLAPVQLSLLDCEDVTDGLYAGDSTVWTPEGPATLVGSVADVLACLVAFQTVDALTTYQTPDGTWWPWYEPGS